MLQQLFIYVIVTVCSTIKLFLRLLQRFYFTLIVFAMYKRALNFTSVIITFMIHSMNDGRNENVQELFKLCGTDHRISSAYHPQSNGLDERMNQTLTRAIVKFLLCCY